MQASPIHRRLLGMLSCLTILFISWQIAFFSIHYHVSELIDSFANASISNQFIHFTVLAPIIGYILIQIISYALIIAYTYFIATSVGQSLRLSPLIIYWLGVACLTLAFADLLALNSHYFPFSFFNTTLFHPYFIWLSTLFWLISSLIAYFHFFRNTPSHATGWLFIAIILINILCALRPTIHAAPSKSSQPNIILIGLDSLRPDFTHFYGNASVHTPTIDQFLQTATTYSQAYTPLARTFPSWVSILTARHPKHHHARNNLADIPSTTYTDTLAWQLQQAGYYTLYATDEKRFSNITKQYGFNELVGPSMGVNDFILGGLSDFPLANLLTIMPAAKFILPYNFANRAAAVTYRPEQFLTEINDTLSKRPGKPLFLAVHFCLTHWPFTWADKAGKNELMPQQYRHSIEAVDTQLAELLSLLKQQGLLENSIVVLLSDHGTSLGLPHDTLLSESTYHGDRSLLKQVPVTRLSGTSPDSVDFKHDYSISTAYGQGTHVASLKQYRTLLAFKRYGSEPFKSYAATSTASLTDIAPTILTLLKLPSLKTSDGASLANDLMGTISRQTSPRPIFIETGDSLTEIETDHIYFEKVVAKKIGIYRVDPNTGLLTMDPLAERSININKQRAIIYGDWLLARFPATTHNKLVAVKNHPSKVKMSAVITPGYYLLANIRTGQWTIGLNTAFAKTAPTKLLNKKLHEFYGDEIQ